MGLRERAAACPALAGEQLTFALWALRSHGKTHPRELLTATDVVG